jgi:predicted RNA binding protein YcfA (HicA-like mRNA interferase family)
MGRPRKYREVVKILRKHDSRFEFWEDRGKGSERIIYHPDINGRPASIPVKCHGEGTELRKGIISAIIRRFNLPDGLL